MEFPKRVDEACNGLVVALELGQLGRMMSPEQAGCNNVGKPFTRSFPTFFLKKTRSHRD